MRDYPAMVDHTGQAEPAPRRVRGFLGGRKVFDTVRALYVWDSPRYPQYHIPVADVDNALLVDENRVHHLRRGTARSFGLRSGEVNRPGAVRIYGSDASPGLADTARFSWPDLDSWYEEDEQIFVHPRNPYTRVDALRSSRTVQVQIEGQPVAESAASVMVFETGLPTRYYFDRTEIDFSHLTPTGTVTECPYKGRTTAYWTAQAGDTVLEDIAWSYDFPTRQLLPIAGLVSFYNEKTDIVVDGRLLERPQTPFS